MAALAQPAGQALDAAVGRVLLPFAYLLMAYNGRGPLAARVLTGVLMLVALVQRLVIRKRLGVQA